MMERFNVTIARDGRAFTRVISAETPADALHTAEIDHLGASCHVAGSLGRVTPADTTPGRCPECERGHGPNYRGRCEHGR